MPVSAFPSRATLQPLDEFELQPETPISKSPDFPDGGCDLNVDADTVTRRWVILFDGHTEAEIATLDAHVNSAKYKDDVGSAFTFNYTTRSGELLSGVRYDRGGYDRSQSKVYSQRRSVKLIKQP